MTQHCGETEQKAEASETNLHHEERHTKDALSEDNTERHVSRRQSTEKAPEIKESKPNSTKNVEVRTRYRVYNSDKLTALTDLIGFLN